MCLDHTVTTEEEVRLVETLARTLDEGSVLGSFLTHVMAQVRMGVSICFVALPPEDPSAPAGPPSPN